jgi:hypothetical protein
MDGFWADQVAWARPPGRIRRLNPLRALLPSEPGTELVRAHRERGITPDAWTATPLWHGEILDYGLAIDMFRSLKVPEGEGGPLR